MTKYPLPRCVILFDIDGTLVRGPINAPSAGLLSMQQSASIILNGSRDLPEFDYSGMTDTQIASRLLYCPSIGFPETKSVGLLLENYIRLLETNVLTHPYVALGNPEKAVLGLMEMGAIIGLGTGNLREGSSIKLASAGISHLFDLDLGGYARQGNDRAQVLTRGATRCDPSGDLPVLVIGDTHLDVEAARAIGAVCIGVPFGSSTEASLISAGADFVIDQVDGNLSILVKKLLSN